MGFENLYSRGTEVSDGMGLYTCQDCGHAWIEDESEVCEGCGLTRPGHDGCPECGSSVWNGVDMGKEFFFLLGEGLTPARAVYYYLNRVHGLPVSEIASLCGRSETSVYNVINKAEEALADA